MAPLDALELTTSILESTWSASTAVVPGEDSRLGCLARGLEELDTNPYPLCVVHAGTNNPRKGFVLTAMLVESGTKWLTVDDSPLNSKVTSSRDLNDAVELDFGHSL